MPHVVDCYLSIKNYEVLVCTTAQTGLDNTILSERSLWWMDTSGGSFCMKCLESRWKELTACLELGE